MKRKETILSYNEYILGHAYSQLLCLWPIPGSLLVVKFRIHVFGFYPSVFFVGLNMNYQVTNNSASPLKISSVYSHTRLTKDLRIRAMCFYTSRIMLARFLENALYFSQMYLAREFAGQGTSFTSQFS